MRKLLRFLPLALLLAVPTVALSTGVLNEVCSVRQDLDGDCVADVLGEQVTVEGVVLAWKHFGPRGPGAIYDENSGCCISVFDIADAPNIPVGHRVQITGWMGNFSGLDEITDDPADGTNDPLVTDLGPGVLPPTIPAPGVELRDGSSMAEGWESCLVEICGQFTDAGGTFETFSANYEFIATDGEICEVRIDSDTGIGGTTIPNGTVSVVGILSQFDGFGANLCGGYQVLPRRPSDITTSCSPVQSRETSWGRLKSITR